MERELKELGLNTVEDLKHKIQANTLREHIGEKAANHLLEIAHGRDPTPILERGPAKSITVEDSFKMCQSLKAVETVVGVLAPDLVTRLREELDESGRWPKTLVVKWRLRSSGVNNRSSASSSFPMAFGPNVGEQALVKAVASLAGSLLSKSLMSPFNLTLINLGATNFHEKPASAALAPISKYFKPPDNGTPQAHPPNTGQRKSEQNSETQAVRLGTTGGGLTSLECSMSSKYYKSVPQMLVSKRKEREQWERDQGYDVVASKKRKQEGELGDFCSGGVRQGGSDECEVASVSWAAQILKQAAGVRVEPTELDVDGWNPRKQPFNTPASSESLAQVAGMHRASVSMRTPSERDSQQTLGINWQRLQKSWNGRSEIESPAVSREVVDRATSQKTSNNAIGFKDFGSGGLEPGKEGGGSRSWEGPQFLDPDLKLARKLQDEENRTWRVREEMSNAPPGGAVGTMTQPANKSKRKGPMDAFVVRKK